MKNFPRSILRKIKIIFSFLPLMFFLFFQNLNIVFSETSTSESSTNDVASNENSSSGGVDLGNYETPTVDLRSMGLLHFGGPQNLEGFILQVMRIIAILIILISTLGGMIGGIILITSGGSENRAETGKNVITASIIGLILVFTAYLVVTLLQSFLYSF